MCIGKTALNASERALHSSTRAIHSSKYSSRRPLHSAKEPSMHSQSVTHEAPELPHPSSFGQHFKVSIFIFFFPNTLRACSILGFGINILPENAQHEFWRFFLPFLKHSRHAATWVWAREYYCCSCSRNAGQQRWDVCVCKGERCVCV